jgi:putative N-acetyltransferase (TIGR04045 family)
MDLGNVAPFVPPHVGIRPALAPWERAAAFALRRRVFCDEQRIFAGDDRDAADEHAQTIVAVTYLMGMADRVVGTVRIHETAPRRWTGSRLAIAPDCRGTYGLGAGLIHRAVATANAAGCDAFLATVQLPNVAFFRRLHWDEIGACEVNGHPHALMRADLAAYPPLASAAHATLLAVRRAS